MNREKIIWSSGKSIPMKEERERKGRNTQLVLQEKGNHISVYIVLIFRKQSETPHQVMEIFIKAFLNERRLDWEEKSLQNPQFSFSDHMTRFNAMWCQQYLPQYQLPIFHHFPIFHFDNYWESSGDQLLPVPSKLGFLNKRGRKH